MPIEKSQITYPRVTAILPMYNEGDNVGDVLSILREVSTLEEIVVVDDGSIDDGANIVRQASKQDTRIRLIQHPTNSGKGQAIFSGWQSSQATYILLLDADLVNLTPKHIHDLLDPVLSQEVDMTLGLFSGGRLPTDLSHWATPWLTGQRAIRSDILKYVSREAAIGYGFEVALSIAARQYGFRTRKIYLKGMWHPPSEFHRGWLFGVYWRARMYAQIIRAWYIASRERYPSVKAFFSTILKT